MKLKITFNRAFKLVFVSVFLVTLSGCFVAKEYERPSVIEVNENLFRTNNIQTDSMSMATISWRDMFSDEKLKMLIDTALQNNLDIRVAIEKINASKAYLNQGKAGYFPTLNSNVSVSRNYPSANGQQGAILRNLGFTYIDLFELSGSLSWEADIWGKIRSTKRAYNATYLQSLAAHKAVKTKLVADVASLYYQLLMLDEQVAVTEKTIENRSKSWETSKDLKKAGNITEVSVKQAEAQLHTAKALLVDLNMQIRLLENSLSILIGDTPQKIERGELSNQDITTKLKVGVPAQLLSNRPDLLAAEYNLINAFELSNVARSNFYPSFTLTASGGLQSLDISNFFSVNSLFASLAGGLTQPIFNRRKIKTEYEVAQAQQKQASLMFKQTFLQATKEVSDALYMYEATTQKIEIKEKEFEAYKLATEYSNDLLNNGYANYLEVLVSQENALNSELNLINIRYTQLKSVVDLYKALGGGWK